MRIFIIVIVLIITPSCSSTNELSKVQEESLEVLNDVILKSNGEIYYKSINSDRQEPISSYVQKYLLEFHLCVKDIDRSKTKISEQEVSYLHERFSNHKIVRLDKLSSEFSEKTVKKHKRFKTVSISLPVVFRNGTMAIYYVSGTYGGGFSLLQKSNNNWNIICGNTVWIE